MIYILRVFYFNPLSHTEYAADNFENIHAKNGKYIYIYIKVKLLNTDENNYFFSLNAFKKVCRKRDTALRSYLSFSSIFKYFEKSNALSVYR